ncbi:MAG TPA: OsmC family protein [Ilumatobacter sp.]|nr:OsmC family protein [Ilumatobacter sp.]
MTTTETAAADNGVNTQALLDARAALVDAPEAAEFTWRATNEWLRGTHSRSTIEQFAGLGAEHSHKSVFTYDSDHPEVFAAEDAAPTPVEFLLVGLAGCLTAGVAAVAQNRGIQLNSVKATLEGDLNILGILGGDPDVRNGYKEIRVHYDIDADASQEDIAALVAQSQKRSAVYDAITNPTNVTVSVN